MDRFHNPIGAFRRKADYINEHFEDVENDTNSLTNGFIWIEEPTGQQDNGYSIITGIVQNISDKKYSKVIIKFNLYDASGNQIGTAQAVIQDLKTGGTWKFEAIGRGNASRFEFSEIEAW